MIASKATSPHAFSVVEVDYNNVDVTRGKQKSGSKASEGFSLTYLPFISRAVVDALEEFPRLNASVATDQLIVHKFIDLGIAVDLDYEGLIVPIVRGAEGKRLGAIAREIHDLATRAQTERLAARRDLGGYVHDLEQRLGWLGADVPDHQPAAGGDPVDGLDRAQARGQRTSPTAPRPS